MKRTFNRAVFELAQQGEDVLVALKKVEESGEFTEEEIQAWFDGFYNARTTNKRTTNSKINNKEY